MDEEGADKEKLSVAQTLSMWSIYFLLGIFALFPLSWMRKLGAGIGSLYYQLNKKRVRIARINLKLCYPNLTEQEREKLVKEVIQSAGMWFFESGAIWLWPIEKIIRKVEIENVEVFERALHCESKSSEGDSCENKPSGKEPTGQRSNRKISARKGTILAIPHTGNWEVMGAFTSTCCEFACLYQHQTNNVALGEFVRRRRARTGTVLAPANGVGIRRLYKHLRSGKVAGLLPDHFPSEEMGVFAPFFGQPAFTGTLISSLAKKNNSQVLASAVIRTKKGFKIHFIEVENQDSDDPVVAATSLNRAIEQCIALAPGQFQWVYPRFRRRLDPITQADPYR